MNIIKPTMTIIGKILLLAVMVFALMIVVMVPIVIVAYSLHDGMPIEELIETLFMVQSMMIAQTICVIGAVILMYISFDRKSGLTLGWKQSYRFRAAIAGSSWGIVMMTALFLCIWVFGGLRILDVQLDRTVVGSLVYGLILFSLVAINEELLGGIFRDCYVRRWDHSLRSLLPLYYSHLYT